MDYDPKFLLTIHLVHVLPFCGTSGRTRTGHYEHYPQRIGYSVYGCDGICHHMRFTGEQPDRPGTIRQHVRIGYVFVLPLVLFFALFPDLVLSIYTDIPDLKEASIPSLWVLCSAYLILVPANVYFQAVSGTGNTRTALGLELCVLAVYLAYITYVILYLRVDVAFCWTTEHLYGICILTLSYIYIKKGNWQKKQI